MLKRVSGAQTGMVQENLTARANVTGGSFCPENLESMSTFLTQHNFVNRLDIIVKKNDYVQVGNQLNGILASDNIKFTSNLFKLLPAILEMDAVQRKNLKLVTINKNVTHDNSICITDGQLTLKLRSDSYNKSGFDFPLSNFSKGNKNFRELMYIYTFSLVEFEDMMKKTKNYVRLLWFAENVSIDEYEFIATFEKDFQNEFIVKLKANGIENFVETRSVPSNYDLSNCLTPNLIIEEDEDKLAEQLEWITYAALKGIQLYENVDPYISRYREMLDSETDTDLVVVTLKDCLISSGKHVLILNLLQNLNFFALVSCGVKNCTKSYKNSGEHSIIDDGSNDVIIFVNDGKFALWETVDSGDSHFYNK